MEETKGIKSFIKDAVESSGQKYSDELANDVLKKYNNNYDSIINDIAKENQVKDIDAFRDDIYSRYDFSPTTPDNSLHTTEKPKIVVPDLAEKQKQFRYNPRVAMGMPLDEAQQIANNVADENIEERKNWKGFGKELVLQGKSSVNDLTAAIYGTPGFAYDFIGSGFRALNIPVPEWDESIFTKDATVGKRDINPLSVLEKNKNILLDASKKNTEEVIKLNPDYIKGVQNAFAEGKTEEGIRNLFSSVMRSAAPSAAMMLTGGMSAPSAMGTTAAVFGSMNLNEADQLGEYGKIGRDGVVAVSAITGAIEYIFERNLGSGAAGNAIRKMISEKGEDVVKKEIKQTWQDQVSNMIIKNPWMAPFGEAYEEIGTQLAQNAVNKYSGYMPDIKITDGVIDAGLMGSVSGGIHMSMIKAIQQGINASGDAMATRQVKKAYNRSIALLEDIPDANYTEAVYNATQNFTDPQQLFDTFQEINQAFEVSQEDFMKAFEFVANSARYTQMSKTREQQIQDAINEHTGSDGNVTTVTINNAEGYVRNPEDLGKEGKIIFVKTAEGVKPVQSAKIKDWNTQTPEEVYSTIKQEDEMNERLAEEQELLAEQQQLLTGIEEGAQITNDQTQGNLRVVEFSNGQSKAIEEGQELIFNTPEELQGFLSDYAQEEIKLQQKEQNDDLEQKKADIERSRQDELNSGFTKDATTWINDPLTKEGRRSNGTKGFNFNYKKPEVTFSWLDGSEATTLKLNVEETKEWNKLRKILREGTPSERSKAERSLIKKIIDRHLSEINAKYDAELAALEEQQPVNIDELTPEERYAELSKEDPEIASEMLVSDIEGLRAQANEIRQAVVSTPSEKVNNLKQAKQLEAEAARLETLLQPTSEKLTETENISENKSSNVDQSENLTTEKQNDQNSQQNKVDQNIQPPTFTSSQSWTRKEVEEIKGWYNNGDISIDRIKEIAGTLTGQQHQNYIVAAYELETGNSYTHTIGKINTSYFEDVNNIPALAQRIINGEEITEEDKQLQSNFPKELEKELQLQKRTTKTPTREEYDGTANEWTAEYSEDANEIAAAFEDEKQNSPYNQLTEWQRELIDSGETFSHDSFTRLGDRNQIGRALAKRWLRAKSTTIDQWVTAWNMAIEEGQKGGEPIDVQDVVDFIISNPSGSARKTTNTQNDLRRRYREITGMSINNHKFTQAAEEGKDVLSWIESKGIDTELLDWNSVKDLINENRQELTEEQFRDFTEYVEQQLESIRQVEEFLGEKQKDQPEHNQQPDKKELDNNVPFRAAPAFTITETAQQDLRNRQNAVKALNKLQEQFNIPITVINSNEMPEDVADRAHRLKVVPKAFYQNGTAYIISDQISSVSDVKKSFLHEAVLHKGLDLIFENGPVTLLGKTYQNKNQFLDEVFRRLDDNTIADRAIDYGKAFFNQLFEQTEKGYRLKEGASYDQLTDDQKRELAEEVLATLSETESPRLQVLLDSLWKYMKKLIGWSSKQFTKSDLRNMLSEHRKLVKQATGVQTKGTGESKFRTDISREDFQNQMEEKYPGLKLFLGGRNDILKLSEIQLPKEQQGKGTGTQVMNEITNWADKNDLTVTLTPSTDYGATSVARLKRFYKRFGFVDNKGRNKDFTVSDSMLRIPRNDIRFKVAGEWGAYNIDRANETSLRINNLGVAKQMEKDGKSPKEIKIFTGWERGADKLWRYEISDGKWTETVRKMIDSQNRNNIPETWGLNYPRKVSQLISDNELFEAYPDIKELPVHININKDNDNSGSFKRDPNGLYPENDKITVNANSFDNALSILNHELQHYIQDVEKFAQGGSTSRIKKMHFELMEGINFYNEILSKAYREGNKELYDKAMTEKLNKVSELQHIEGMYGLGPSQAYQRLAGEVEARNVQQRMNLTPEERLTTLLEETEDIARKDQIFIKEGLNSGLREPEIRFRTEEQNKIIQDARKYDNVNDFIDAYEEANFRDMHRAPGNPGEYESMQDRMDEGTDFNLAEVAQGYSVQPDDYFDPKNGPRWYGYNDYAGMQSYRAIRKAFDKIQEQVFDGEEISDMPTLLAYRAVPNSVDTDVLHDGDWITFSEQYAIDHGEHRFGEDEYKIIAEEVPADQLWWDGNDINEWGYDTGETEFLGRSDLIRIWNEANTEPKFRTDTPEFKNWFGNSKVVDENGKPLVVYHGTNREFSIFQQGRVGAMYFSDDITYSKGYGKNIMPVYLKIEKLADLTDTESDAYKLAVKEFNKSGGWEFSDGAMDERDTPDYDPALDNSWELMDKPGMPEVLHEAGYDGFKMNETGGDEAFISYAVFSPTQIKSATGNNGEFDGNNPDIRFRITGDPRRSLTNVRGGWTKEKIIKELKSIKKGKGNYGKFSLLYGISTFENAKDLRDHLFYHGTGTGVYGGLYPSITMSEREAERYGGGGYGERYYAVSVSKSKRKASAFSGMSSTISVYPVILNKQAKVINRPDIQDSVELEDIIEELWNEGVDAVRIGRWNDEASEQELAVLNPIAISTWSESQSMRVFGSKMSDFTERTDDELDYIISQAKEAIIKMEEWKTNNIPKTESWDEYSERVKDLPLEERRNELEKRKQIRSEYNRLREAYQRELASDIKFRIDEAAKETNTNPSDEQKHAGNYKMGHVRFDGFDISIENPKGSVRSGTNKKGEKWERQLPADYGYFRGTVGRDKDHIDVFIGPKPENDRIYVIDQIDPETGNYDEAKVMLGFDNVSQARRTYLEAYETGWKGLGEITRTDKQGLKDWFKSEQTIKPFYNYAATSEQMSPSGDRSEATGVRFAIRSDNPEVDQLFRQLDKLQRQSRAAKRMKELKVDAEQAMVFELPEILKQIKDMKEGIRLGHYHAKDRIKEIQKVLIDYAKRNMPYDEVGKRDMFAVITKIRDAQTPKAIEKAFEKIDEITKDNESNKNIRAVERLIKWMTNFRQKGQNKEGKFTYETVKEFEEFKRIHKEAIALAAVKNNNKSNAKQKAEADKALEKMWQEIEEKENKTLLDITTQKLIELRRNGKASSKELIQAIREDLQAIYDAAKDAKTAEDIEKVIYRKEDRDFVKQFLDGTPIAERKRIERWMANINGFLADTMGNWETILTMMGGYKLRDKFSLIINQVEKEVNTQEAFDNVMDTAMKGYKLKDKKALQNKLNDMKKKEYSIVKPIREGDRGEGSDIPLSKLMLIDIYNAIQNEEIAEDMYLSYGNRVTNPDDGRPNEILQRRIGKERIDKLMENLDEGDIIFAQAMQQAADSYYSKINDVFIRTFNRDLPKRDNYWPSTAEFQNENDAFNQMLNDSLHPSATKERATRRTPKITDAFEKFAKHIKNAEWYANMALPVTRLNNIFKNPNVKDLITDQYGENFYRLITEHLQEQGLYPKSKASSLTQAEQAADWLLNNWVAASIGLTPSVPVKQLLSVINYTENMPVGTWSANFIKNMANPAKTWKEMMEIPYLKTRLGTGYSEAVQHALNSDEGVKRITSMHQAMKEFATIGTRYGDIAAIAFGGKPYLDYLLSTGMDEKEAVDQFLLDTLRSQQSPFSSTLSKFQNSKTPLKRALFAFSNTPSQYMRKMVEGVHAYKKGDITKGQLTKVLTIYGILNNVSYVVVGALMASLLSGDDWDDDILKKLIVQTGTSVVGGIPLVKDIVETIMNVSTDSYIFDDVNPILEGPVETIKAFNKAARSDDPEKVKKQVWIGMKYMLQMVGISGRNLEKLYKATVKRGELNDKVNVRETNEELKKLALDNNEPAKELKRAYTRIASKATRLENDGKTAQADRLRRIVKQSKINLSNTDYSKLDIQRELERFNSKVESVRD
nr:LPD23 domain-containing protein [uncultured Draconibacterium sp.]